MEQLTYNQEKYNHVFDEYTEKHYLLRKVKSDLSDLPYKDLGTFNGICFVGDPHISWLNPGKRIDKLQTVADKQTFLETILNKISQIALFCNENKLLPVITGDLFHISNLNNLHLINHIIATFRLFDVKPLCDLGNHDIFNLSLNDSNTLQLLETAGVIRLMKENGLYFTATIKEERVLFGAIPYGQYIPYSLSGYFDESFATENKLKEHYCHQYTEKEIAYVEKEKKGKNKDPMSLKHTKAELAKFNVDHEKIKSVLGVDKVIMVTHHDFAFTGYYPNSIPIQQIIGCDMVINGHIHDRKPVINNGNTYYYNIGNIARLSTDTYEHIPAVYNYLGGQEELNFPQTITPLNARLIDQFNKFIYENIDPSVLETFGYAIRKQTNVETTDEENKRELFEEQEYELLFSDDLIKKMRKDDLTNVNRYRYYFYLALREAQIEKLSLWNKRDHKETLDEDLSFNKQFDITVANMTHSDENSPQLVAYPLDYIKPQYAFHTGTYHTKREMLDELEINAPERKEDHEDFVSLVENMDINQEKQSQLTLETINEIIEQNNVPERIQNAINLLFNRVTEQKNLKE